MTSLRSLVGSAVLAMVAAGCYAQPASAQQTFPEPVEVAGPPGGQMDPNDPAYAQQGQPGQPAPYQGPQGPQGPQGAYQGPDQPQDPTAQDDGQDPPAPQDDGQVAQGQMDPQDPGAATGDVNDDEINQTLDGQGSWSDVDGYGRVWRPDATVVGADFTPYESGGEWVDTDAGWAFNYDDAGWGWLPFHYGRWGWFDGYWGWQPGHRYGNAWVDWRHGGGYTGWRPAGPIGRPGARALAQHDSSWRFAADRDLGRGRIRSHLFNNPAEGLRVTSSVASPGFHGAAQVRASSLMGNRIAARSSVANGGYNRGGANGYRPGGNTQIRTQPRIDQPWQTHAVPSRQPQGYRQPSYGAQGGQGYRQAPPQSYRQAPAYRQAPQRAAPSYRMPSSSYRAPAPSYHPSSSSSSHSSSSYHSSGGSSSHSSGGGGGGHSSGGHHR